MATQEEFNAKPKPLPTARGYLLSIAIAIILLAIIVVVIVVMSLWMMNNLESSSQVCNTIASTYNATTCSNMQNVIANYRNNIA